MLSKIEQYVNHLNFLFANFLCSFVWLSKLRGTPLQCQHISVLLTRTSALFYAFERIFFFHLQSEPVKWQRVEKISVQITNGRVAWLDFWGPSLLKSLRQQSKHSIWFRFLFRLNIFIFFHRLNLLFFRWFRRCRVSHSNSLLKHDCDLGQVLL